MARRIHKSASRQPAPTTGDEGMDATQRRLLEDFELADYLRQKQAEAARIAGEAQVERGRKG